MNFKNRVIVSAFLFGALFMIYRKTGFAYIEGNWIATVFLRSASAAIIVNVLYWFFFGSKSWLQETFRGVKFERISMNPPDDEPESGPAPDADRERQAV